MTTFRRNIVWGVLAMLFMLSAQGRSAEPVRLTVQSDPPGATVTLDGKKLEVRTPARLNVAPGVHQLRLEKAGFKAASRKVEAYAGAGFVSFHLDPVNSAPAVNPISEPIIPAPAQPAPRNIPAPAAKTIAIESPEPPPRAKADKPSPVPSEPVNVEYRDQREEQKDSWNLLPLENPFSRWISSKTGKDGPTPADESAAPDDNGADALPDEIDSDSVFPLVTRGESGKTWTAPSDGDSAAEEAGEDSPLEPASPISGDSAAQSAAAKPETTNMAQCVSGDAVMPGEETPARVCLPTPRVDWPDSAEELMFRAAADLPQFPEKFNILLLGLDRRDRKGMLATGAAIPDEVLKRKPANSDVIAVVQLDFIDHQVRMVSIPRDTKARIPGHGSRKINSAYAFGRERLSKRVVESFLNIPIHRTVVVDWKGAKECIALFKGLGLDYNGFSEQELFWHLRKRSFARGDFHRIERQQSFLRYAAGEYLRIYNEARRSEGTVAAVKKSMLDMALKQGMRAVDTDMSYEEVQLLAYAFRDYNVRQMTLAQVTGRGGLEGGDGEESQAVYFFNAGAKHSFDEIIARAEADAANP
jgi:hypothetical protein